MIRWVALASMFLSVFALPHSVLGQSQETSPGPAKAPAKSPANKGPAKAPPKKSTPASIKKDATDRTMGIVTESLAALAKLEDPKPIEAKLADELYVLAENSDPVTDVDLFYAVASARRVAILFAQAKDPAVRSDLVRCFRKSPSFITELAFVLDEADNGPQVVELASKLSKSFGPRLEEYATLAAAICVVHDRPVSEQANENKAVADDPVKLFDYFVASAPHFSLPIKKVPPQLLVFVVDTTAKVPELVWAFRNYNGVREIGKQFFEIEYDEAHFLTGAPKKVTTLGFTLPNIRKYGGVCIDQAYFAANVSKAIGIPAAIMRGKSAEVGHAWVAYLNWNKTTATFNSRAGRYPEYRAVVGYVKDPQTGAVVPESHLALRAALALTPARKRQNATAIEDAGILMLNKLLPEDEAMAMDASGKPIHKHLTPEKVARVLALSEAAVNLALGSTRAWDLGVAVGVTGSWTPEQRNRWGEAIYKSLGENYGSYAVDRLIEVISSVDDLQKQNDMWNWLFACTMRNGDMASVVRFNQAAMFENDHNPDKAWECYEWILKLYADTSPMAAQAGQRILVLLKRNGKSFSAGMQILRDAWGRTTPPSSLNPDFAAQSNWFKIGVYYYIALDDAGQKVEAGKVAKTLGFDPKTFKRPS